ncbi:MAG: PHP domain-containing protein [Clostridiales bacterium]|jgi:predicted metal-dependent phosphoesterase TrpH|nr:PHP domain-containing protein [Clostridiales bacterium]
MEKTEEKAGTVKCELHLHTKGSSPCARVEAEEIARLYSEAGYGAIAVTNHYMKYLFDSYYPPLSDLKKAEMYLGLYRELKEKCRPYGIKVFLGMELNPECMNTEVVPAAEFLCYGLTEEFLLRHPRLFDLSQRRLFELFEENGILMYQSHPFRSYCVQADPKLMHGVEVRNGHPKQENNNEEALRFAEEHCLLQIAGSDFHEGAITAGIYIPEDVADGARLVKYLRSGNPPLIVEK